MEENIPQGKLYWLKQNLKDSFINHLKRHKLRLFFTALVLSIALFLTRAMWQPYILNVRSHSHYLVFSLLLLIPFYFFVKYGKQKKYRLFIPFLCVLMALAQILPALLLDFNGLEYLRLWQRFQTLETRELTERPLTRHERVLPRYGIYSIARTKLEESEFVQMPSHVRINDSYYWTMTIEPQGKWNRFGGVNEVFIVSAEQPAPAFRKDDRAPVSFEVGENLLLWKNVYTNTRKTFLNLWKFISYEPGEMRIMRDDSGEVVQVVPLIKWEGLFFPRPVFGGVTIIPQTEDSGFRDLFDLVVLGIRKYISPEEIKDFKFLTGQNLMPEKVSRYIGESFHFRKGFFAPIRHRGDIRIADMPGDMNDQPFSTFYDFSEDADDKFYASFSMEPYNPMSQGLSISVLIPGDGIGPVSYYPYADRKESLFGISTIPQRIRESKKAYSWGEGVIVSEIKPWVRLIDGKVRHFWLGTVVSMSTSVDIDKSAQKTLDKSGGDKSPESGNNYSKSNVKQIFGSLPEIALVDAEQGSVIWVDPLKMDGWEETVAFQMKDVWKKQ